VRALRLLSLALLLQIGAASAEDAPFAPLHDAIEAGDHGPIVALVVERGGEVVFEHRYRAGSARRPQPKRDPALHDIRSAGKSITALAVGAAIADGALASVEVPVWPLLGVDEPGAYAQITVRDLLVMGSALQCSDDDPKSPGNEERMYRTRRWRDFALAIPLDASFGRNEQGVGRWSYCTAGVFLLGQVVEAVTGEAFDAFVQRRLFDPLGIESVVWNRSRSGEVQSGGQLEIAAVDVTKLGRLVLNRGRWGEARVVPEAWIEEMLRPIRRNGPVGYGYLWWLRGMPSPGGTALGWGMQGNGGNLVVAFAALDTVVTVQSAAYNTPGAHERSYGIVQEVLALMAATAPEGP